MKTESHKYNSAAKNKITEEKVRRSLHPLQPDATDKENLVGGGRVLKSSTPFKDDVKKNEISYDNIKTDSKKKKNVTLKDNFAQTSPNYKEIEINKKDLTSDAPSENYWQVIAERRRIALNEALEENKTFGERISALEEENQIYKEQLDECRALIDVLKEMLSDDENYINNSLEDTL